MPFLACTNGAHEQHSVQIDMGIKQGNDGQRADDAQQPARCNLATISHHLRIRCRGHAPQGKQAIAQQKQHASHAQPPGPVWVARQQAGHARHTQADEHSVRDHTPGHAGTHVLALDGLTQHIQVLRTDRDDQRKTYGKSGQPRSRHICIPHAPDSQRPANISKIKKSLSN